jgi:hypothetical protein
MVSQHKKDRERKVPLTEAAVNYHIKEWRLIV